jgi:hypothetical protein
MSDTVKYLGDGVYASFDGYQLWLRVGSHDAPPVVALEPLVVSNLIEHAIALGVIAIIPRIEPTQRPAPIVPTHDEMAREALLDRLWAYDRTRNTAWREPHVDAWEWIELKPALDGGLVLTEADSKDEAILNGQAFFAAKRHTIQHPSGFWYVPCIPF